MRSEICRVAPLRDSANASMADRVLVVDDEQSLRKVLAATLQREGYEVTVCSNGEEAITPTGARSLNTS